MKKLCCLFLLCGSLFANDTLENSSSLVKQGFDSLIEDMHKIKQSNQENRVQIEALHKKFDYVISILQKNNVSKSISSTNVQDLEKTISALENKVEQLEQQLSSKNALALSLSEKQVDVKNDTIVEDNKVFYNPKPKPVIVSEEAIENIEEDTSATFSIQVGIFREKDSLKNAKTIFEKIIDKSTNKVVFETCSTCKNKDLTKVLIAGFKSKEEAQNFVQAHSLKNSMIIDNRG